MLAFQRDHGLPQVGRAGSQTKGALARRAHPPSRPPTPASVPQQNPPSPNGYAGSTTTPYQPSAGTQTAPSYGQGGSGRNGR